MIYRSILGPVYDLQVNFGRYAYDPHVIFGGLCTICRSILDGPFTIQRALFGVWLRFAGYFWSLFTIHRFTLECLSAIFKSILKNLATIHRLFLAIYRPFGEWPVYDLQAIFGKSIYDPGLFLLGGGAGCDPQVNGHNPRANFVGSVYDQQFILWGLHTFYAGEMGDQTGPASARRRACYPLSPA